MKKRALLLGMMLTLAVTSVGCGKKEADANITEPIYEESSEEAVVGDVETMRRKKIFRMVKSVMS